MLLLFDGLDWTSPSWIDVDRLVAKGKWSCVVAGRANSHWREIVMNRSKQLLFVAMVMAATLIIGADNNAIAQDDDQYSTAVLNTSGMLDDISMFLVPNGTGTPLSWCFERGGTPVVAEILVTMRDADGNVIVDWPASFIRLEYSDSPLIWCDTSSFPPPAHAPNFADAPTNEEGQTKFTMAYYGGGAVEGPTYVWNVADPWGYYQRIATPVNVSYNSADINGDRIVNLTDVGLFASDYFSGYRYRTDFNYDQRHTLVDVGMFATALGAACP